MKTQYTNVGIRMHRKHVAVYVCMRFAFLLAFPWVVASYAIGCSETVPLGTQGALCDEDLQCAHPLVCRCVIRQGTGDEGPDEIVAHGHCDPPTTPCTHNDAEGDASVE